MGCKEAHIIAQVNEAVIISQSVITLLLCFQNKSKMGDELADQLQAYLFLGPSSLSNYHNLLQCSSQTTSFEISVSQSKAQAFRY